jgi:hypothetical protein
MGVPKFEDVTRKVVNSDRQIKVVMDFMPQITPGGGPDARVTFVHLNNTVFNQNVFYANY